MDPMMDQQKLQPFSNFKKPKSLKKTLQILFSILILLFFSLHTPLIIYFTIQIFTPPSIVSHIIIHLTTRQVMIILFNCILLFVTGRSGLFSDRLHNEPPPMMLKSVNYSKAIVVYREEVVETYVESMDLVVVEEKEEKEEEGEELEYLSKEMLNKRFDESIEKVLVVVEEKEEEELESLTTEELKKRFDEFIEKVKRQRRLEETLQLVMIH
ncbi:hypothetical protein QJS04_geneDACA005292 [Acorus gramineus]|uniref:DUF4408 domain-containing protein n=1 Tax=Acorus gramineus TaxID=55184 RepID=A0AAV9AVJ6_ACOGR|nr:hypothetical protein QJS04_geneDACA005292 [Acorus gramineus]